MVDTTSGAPFISTAHDCALPGIRVPPAQPRPAHLGKFSERNWAHGYRPRRDSVAVVVDGRTFCPGSGAALRGAWQTVSTAHAAGEIESIEIVKDSIRIAHLGCGGVPPAIFVTTKRRTGVVPP